MEQNKKPMQRLKDLRLQKKMSQAEVASYIGKTVQAYSLYETGKAKPPLDTIEKLAALFNISIDYLVDAQSDCKDSPVEAFAPRLNNLMFSHCINCQELAIELDIPELNIELYLGSSLEPTTSILVKLADYFDVSLDYLLGRSEHMDGMTPPDLIDRENKLLENLEDHLKGAYNHAKNDLPLSKLKGVIEAFEKMIDK